MAFLNFASSPATHDRCATQDMDRRPHLLVSLYSLSPLLCLLAAARFVLPGLPFGARLDVSAIATRLVLEMRTM
eukprot:XP_001706340.1 Hypothetical protein GL50803_31107 [Giardia lamblia ATCC 50803]